MRVHFSQTVSSADYIDTPTFSFQENNFKLFLSTALIFESIVELDEIFFFGKYSVEKNRFDFFL